MRNGGAVLYRGILFYGSSILTCVSIYFFPYMKGSVIVLLR